MFSETQSRFIVEIEGCMHNRPAAVLLSGHQKVQPPKYSQNSDSHEMMRSREICLVLGQGQHNQM
jgi:hypothetical protein